MNYPENKKIEDFLGQLTEDDFSESLSAEASAIDKTKYELCKKFVTYLNEKNMSQADLARLIEVDRSRINWIVKYKIQNFTIDRLYELWAVIEPDFELKVS